MGVQNPQKITLPLNSINGRSASGFPSIDTDVFTVTVQMAAINSNGRGAEF